MNGIMIVLTLLSGVALFLYGMSLMGDGLKRVAGNQLELVLYKLTNTPIKGVLLGTIVTAIIQSSSATTVMVVGFVNSGMMKVAQAIGIIMGANIGTSVTGWILCLSYIDGSSGIAQLLSTATISAVVAIIGIIFKMFVKKANYKNVGDIMLGFAILMVGMQTMSGAVSPLKDNPHFVNLLTKFENPFMGIIVGIAFTAVLQSASASVGILQALSVTGSISFAAALPITMGIGVGAACPVLLSSIGTNKNGKRTALIYLLNDLFGMIFWSIVFYSVNAFVHFKFLNMTMSPIKIAMMNSIFRLATIMILLPCINLIEKLVFRLIKDDPEDLEEQADFDLLEERFLNYPPLAITQSQLAVNGMAKKAYKEACKYGDIRVIASSEDDKFTWVPKITKEDVREDADYAYITTNNTIYGTKYNYIPETGNVPLVADMSSNILSEEIDVSRFGMIWAGAQKNVGPAGVTIVIVREDLIGNALDITPTMLNYQTHSDNGSMFNTPPTFAIYMCSLVCEWLDKLGGIKEIQKINEYKAGILYDFLDNSKMFKGTVEKKDRSLMNVPFVTDSDELNAKFIKEAKENGLVNLKGHRSVGGMRASIYNAMPVDGVKKLVDFMKKFETENK